MTKSSPPDTDELVPVSVRLGTVVPPEDPEDWTRPLTWVAALGMLAAPVVTFAWFAFAAPRASDQPMVGTWAVALALVIGAAAAGGTQIGRARAITGTLGAGLLGALLIVMAGAVMAGERQIGSASPTLAHAVGGSVAGLAGVLSGTVVGGLAAGALTRLQRGILAGVVGSLVAATVLPHLF
ncbi:MAG: hypothetical protein ABI978_01280 [Chloroflexota bacterium]